MKIKNISPGPVCLFLLGLCQGLLAQETDLPLAVWDQALNLRLGSGYKDNLLFSRVIEEESPFIYSAAELFLFRLSPSDSQFYLFLNGEDYRYLAGDAVDKEQIVISQAQWKKSWQDKWEASISTQYLYQDQVFDVSATEVDLRTIQVQGHSWSARPSLRWNFSQRFWSDLELNINRQNFIAPLDDYWEGGPKLSLGRIYGHRSDLRLSYEINYRTYDDREQIRPAGSRISGAGLHFLQQELGLASRHHWDRARRWRMTTKLVYLINQDNGPGFFDYTRHQISEQLRYQAKSWEVEGQLKVNYYQYEVQTVSLTDRSRRYKTGLIAGLRAEKSLSKRLKVFLNYEHERSLSNQRLDEYVVNTVSAGIDWEI